MVRKAVGGSAVGDNAVGDNAVGDGAVGDGDALRILVTTDNHVGYNELDAIRKNDAAVTFDEIMTCARHRQVDFVIQGGDLFHKNEPSKLSLYNVINSLKKNCLGDKPIEFEILHDAGISVNFLDPDINVAIPVFAISGNHDDAGGATLLSPLDVLAATGLINHFGRVVDNSQIVLTPILIRKGNTKLALYGMASVRDERLHRTFRDGKVKFVRPKLDPDSWYSILCVHQNHSVHSQKNCLPESFLPGFLDLVIWGHEHRCKIDPIVNKSTGFKVMQPGSSIATSLSEQELDVKQIAILSLRPDKQLSYEKIPLNTVRPLVLRSYCVASDAPVKIRQSRNIAEARVAISAWLEKKVDEMILEALDLWNTSHPDHGDQQPPLPLIRIRLEYTGFEVENPTRFSRRFEGRVANTADILHLYRKPQKSDPQNVANFKAVIDKAQQLDKKDNVRLNDLVNEFIAADKLQLLSLQGMDNALTQFVEKDNKEALRDFIGLQVTKRTTQEMKEQQLNPESYQSVIELANQAKAAKKKPRAARATNAK